MQKDGTVQPSILNNRTSLLLGGPQEPLPQERKEWDSQGLAGRTLGKRGHHKKDVENDIKKKVKAMIQREVQSLKLCKVFFEELELTKERFFLSGGTNKDQ